MKHVRGIALVLAVGVAASCSLPSLAATAVASPASTSPTATGDAARFAPTPLPIGAGEASGTIDAATARVVALERQLGELRSEAAAIEERILVTQTELYQQSIALETARRELAAAQQAYEDRIVAMYKSGDFGLILLVLSSITFEDLVSRSAIVTRIADQDKQAILDTRWSEAQVAYRQVELEELRAQDVILRNVKQDRLDRARFALAQARGLLKTLSDPARKVVAATRVRDAKTRAEWAASSIPLNAEIPQTTCTVEPYEGVSFTCAAYQPHRYRSTGERFRAVCSWYGPGFHGRRAASGQIYNMNDLTCASRTLSFGTRLALTRAGRRVVVVVTDRGPYVDGRDLDLSYAASRALGFSGVEAVEAEVVEPLE